MKAERTEADIQFMIDMTKAIGVKLARPDFQDAIRLGKKVEEKDRPLLVTMVTEESKSNIFRNIGKMANTKFKDVSINHDMTKMEREQNKKMVASAKEMESKDASGLWHYRVRGPPWDRKIIKLPKTKGQEQQGNPAAAHSRQEVAKEKPK